jgi:hypothetical protein
MHLFGLYTLIFCLYKFSITFFFVQYISCVIRRFSLKGLDAACCIKTDSKCKYRRSFGSILSILLPYFERYTNYCTFSTPKQTELFHQRHSYISREVNRTSVTYKGKMHRRGSQFKCETIDREAEMLLWKINYIFMGNNVRISTASGLIYSA